MTSTRALFKNQDYHKLKKECLDNGELFYDEFFPLDVPGAMWLRPKKIVKDPRFFVGNASRFDVIQGDNSGCWLLVAMANLTMNPNLFHHVVPKDQRFTENYAGIFRFNIWQCGKWVEVVIDDRLPTKEGSSGSRKLKFAHSKTDNEFWSALLEKAYAKLYGSYNELTAGWFNEAMVDFTGGVCERVELQPPPDNLEKIICKALEKSSYMCVFMIDDPSIKELVLPNGLVKGHAYSVTKCQTVTARGRSLMLIRLRNPWGKIEWKGPWSDSSPEWNSISSDQKNQMNLVAENDGEFWMPFSDFTQNFEYVDICHLTPDYAFSNTDGKSKTGWESHIFKGDWTKGITAGGLYWESLHMNPQYRIVLTDTDDDSDHLCTVMIALMQKNKTRQIWHKIGFTAFHLKEPEKLSKNPLSEEYIKKNFENSSSCHFRRRRENVVRDAWEPGVYCIMPSTREPGKEGQYLLRVYSEKKASMEEHEATVSDVGKTSIGEKLPSIEQNKTQSPEITSHQIPQQDELVPQVYHKYDTGIPRKTETEQIPQQPGPRISQGNKLIMKNEQQIYSYFHTIAGEEKEIGWQGLQSILEYALTNAQSYEIQSNTSLFSKIISWLFSWFSVSLENKLFSKNECRSLVTWLDDDHSGRLSFDEFLILWRKMEHWELVFLNYSNNSKIMDRTNLSKALKEIDRSVKTSDVSRLIRKYCDNEGQLEFDDFVMCSIDLLTCSK